MLKSIGLLLILILFIDTAVITVSYIRQSNKLTEAGANTTALQSEIDTLNGELVTMRGSVTALQSRLADSDSRAAALQAKLKAAEANATQLQSVLAYTNNEYAKALAGPSPNRTFVPAEPQVPPDYGAGRGDP